MSIDVVYQGLSIAKEARVHFEEGSLFVEVDAPMPVATQLVVSHSDKTPTSTFTGRVRRIRESAAPGTTPPAGYTAGMLITPEGGEKLPRWLMALHPDTVGAAEFQPEPVVEKAPEVAQTAPSATSPEPAVEAAPSSRTPDEHDDKPEDKKPSGGGAAKPKKKKKR